MNTFRLARSLSILVLFVILASLSSQPTQANALQAVLDDLSPNHPGADTLIFSDSFSTNQGWTNNSGGYFSIDPTLGRLNWTARRDTYQTFYIPIPPTSGDVRVKFRIYVDTWANNDLIDVGLAETLNGTYGTANDPTGLFVRTGFLGGGTSYTERYIAPVSLYTDRDPYTYYIWPNRPDTYITYSYDKWYRVELSLIGTNWTLRVWEDDGTTLVGERMGAIPSTHPTYNYFMIMNTLLNDWPTGKGFLDDIEVYSASQAIPADLDVANAALSMASNTQQVKQSQPYSTKLEVMVENHGPGPATNVEVRFLDGPPQTGTELGRTTIAAIPANGSESAVVDWVITTSPVQAELFAEVLTADSNPANNVSATGTSAQVAFADYKHDPHSYSFENWPAGFWDYVSEFTSLTTWQFDPRQNLLLSLVYLLEGPGGHCYGMSETSIIYWETPTARPLPGVDTFDTPKLFAADNIREHQLLQALSSQKQRAYKSHDHIYAFNDIMQRLKAANSSPVILAMDDISSGRHAVVAYKTVQIGTDRYIFIYDNNYPMSTDPAAVEKADYLKVYETPAWLVNDARSDYWKNPIVLDPIRQPDEIGFETLEDIYDILVQKIALSGNFQLSLSWGNGTLSPQSPLAPAAISTVLVTDQFGRMVGVNNGLVVNEIPGAQFIELGIGSYFFILPNDLEYTMVMDNQAAQEISNINLALALPTGLVTIQETHYDDFLIPQGSTATTAFSKSTEDWHISITGSNDVVPDLEGEKTVLYATFLPMINR